MKKKTTHPISLGAICLGALLWMGSAQPSRGEAMPIEPRPDALNSQVSNDELKVQKTPDGPVETLVFAEAVTEHAGTAEEKKCMCQSVCFRAAQLASQLWEDGVFRTYEVARIRTGWNTGGPWEFFSDREMNGEIGDLAMPAEKIVIEKHDGSAATPRKELTLEDNWYEIRLANGQGLFLRVKEGGVFPEEFMALRSRFKGGEESANEAFHRSYDRGIARVSALPFDGISVERIALVQ